MGNKENNYGCIKVEQGKTYQITAYVKSDSEQNISFGIDWITHGTKIDAATGTCYIESYLFNSQRPSIPKGCTTITPNTSWQRAITTFTVTDKTNSYYYISIVPTIYNQLSKNANFWIDGIMVEEVESLNSEPNEFTNSAKATIIDGNSILTDSITADKLTANSITAEKIMADALKSKNYVVGESGSFLNLADGSFDSKYLKWDNVGKVIANDITVVGGSINVNNKFIVNNDGIATLQGATVVGNITAESGKIGKFNLDNLALVTGDTDVTCAGLGGSSQAFWAGSLTMDDAPFRVGYDGSLYSSKGNIAGWEITSDSFYKDTDDYTVYVCPGTNNNKDFLTVHDKNKSSGDEWPFYVHADGWMHCVYGDIGGWNISDSSIYKNGGWKSSSSGSAYFGDYGLSITDKFSVDKNGVLMASDSILSGNVYLSDGSKNIGRFDTGTYNGIKGAALVSLIDGGYSALGNYNSSDNTVYIAAYAKNKKFYVPSDFYVSNLVANDGTIYVSSQMFVSKPIDTNNNTYIFTRTKENYKVSLIGWSVSNNIWIGDYGYGGVRTPASNAFITANNVYKTTSGGNTSLSDERYKHGFKDIPDAFDFIMNLNPCLFKFDDGTSDRYHMGFKAQEVENNMLNTIGDTGLTVKYNFEEGLDVDLDNPDTYILGLRYEEFIAPLIQVVQNQQKQIQDLEKKIAILSN